MTTPTLGAASTGALPRRSPVLAGGLLLAATALLYAVGFDQGALSGALQAVAGDSTAHELFHDARHLLGLPCH